MVSAPAADGVKIFSFDKFNGDDFGLWRFRMEVLFKHYGLLGLMRGTEAEPEEPVAKAEWQRRSMSGYLLLTQCLGASQIQHVQSLIDDADCGPKAWDALIKVHAPTSSSAASLLKKQYNALRIVEGEPIGPVLERFKELYTRMASAGIKLPEEVRCIDILAVLPDSWSPLSIYLNSQREKWSFEWIKEQLLEEEFRRTKLKGQENESVGGLAVGQSKWGGGKGKAKWKGKSKGQHSGVVTSLDQGDERREKKGGGSKRLVGECWYCGKKGHPWFKCYARPADWTP